MNDCAFGKILKTLKARVKLSNKQRYSKDIILKILRSGSYTVVERDIITEIGKLIPYLFNKEQGAIRVETCDGFYIVLSVKIRFTGTVWALELVYYKEA